MNTFVFAVIGFVGAMGIPAFVTAIAETTAAKFEHALPLHAKVIVHRREVH